MPDLVSQVFGILPPSSRRSVASQYRQIERALKLKSTLNRSHSFYGIEVEIENISDALDNAKERFTHHVVTSGNSWVNGVFSLVSDASLKNKGIEFVSSVLDVSCVIPAVKKLYEVISECWPLATFSNRCGIHIHQDVSELTCDQLNSLIAIYSVYEFLIFELAGQERKDNPFCRPLFNFNLNNYISAPESSLFFNSPVEGHFKYSALNVAPITSRGSVEYRHLPGTWDIEKILSFLSVIDRIKKYAVNNEPRKIKDQILKLNTVSNYQAFTTDIFSLKDITALFGNFPDFNQIEAGASNAKRLFNEVKIKSNVSFSSLAKNRKLTKVMDTILTSKFSNVKRGKPLHQLKINNMIDVNILEEPNRAIIINDAIVNNQRNN